jgi:HAD superfamily hydrolase (TIGR01450 family)
MLSQLASPIQALILDMDGVLYQQNQPIGDLPAIFQRIGELGLKVMYATNNTVRTPAQYVDRLAHFGVQSEEWQFITAPLATARALSNRWPEGGPIHMMGEVGLRKVMEDKGFYHADEDVLAVVSGLDKGFTYDMFVKGIRLIVKGAPFIGTNPDLTYPTPEGLSIGTGGQLAILEACSGVKPEIIGKPYPAMMEMALERLGMQPEQTLVIGDRLNTDVASGQAAGCKTALVLSGIATREEAKNWNPRPDIIAEDLTTILSL